MSEGGEGNVCLTGRVGFFGLGMDCCAGAGSGCKTIVRASDRVLGGKGCCAGAGSGCKAIVRASDRVLGGKGCCAGAGSGCKAIVRASDRVLGGKGCCAGAGSGCKAIVRASDRVLGGNGFVKHTVRLEGMHRFGGNCPEFTSFGEHYELNCELK